MKLLLILACACVTWGQITTTAARRVISGANLPTTCNPGDVFFKTSATAGLNQCTATNTWTTVGSGSGSVTSVGLAGTANQITVTGTSPITGSGSWTLSIPTNPTLPGTTTGSFSGSLTGNASTATALAANPADCSANQYANAIAANGDLTCAQVAYSQVSGTPSTSTTVNSQTCTLGSSCTVTANLPSNPAACTAGQYVTDIAADGTLTCAALPMRGISFSFDGGGAALAANKTLYVRVPFACTLTNWSIGSTTAETVTVKLWRVNGGTALPTSSNSISTSGVSLSTGTAVTSSTVSDFTSTAIAAGDWLAATLTAVTASQFVSYVLGCQQ